jgi:hypothetical protein
MRGSFGLLLSESGGRLWLVEVGISAILTVTLAVIVWWMLLCWRDKRNC